MSDIQILILICLLLSFFGLSKYNKIKQSNTQLQINIVETELHSAEQVFQMMLQDSENQEIDWDRSGIGRQKRVIERMQRDLVVLESKRIRFLLFYY
jgi:hypothetical protein